MYFEGEISFHHTCTIFMFNKSTHNNTTTHTTTLNKTDRLTDRDKDKENEMAGMKEGTHKHREIESFFKI